MRFDRYGTAGFGGASRYATTGFGVFRSRLMGAIRAMVGGGGGGREATIELGGGVERRWCDGADGVWDTRRS